MTNYNSANIGINWTNLNHKHQTTTRFTERHNKKPSRKFHEIGILKTHTHNVDISRKTPERKQTKGTIFEDSWPPRIVISKEHFLSFGTRFTYQSKPRTDVVSWQRRGGNDPRDERGIQGEFPRNFPAFSGPFVRTFPHSFCAESNNTRYKLRPPLFHVWKFRGKSGLGKFAMVHCGGFRATELLGF